MAPIPPAAACVLVNGAGTDPAQIVWAPSMAPADRALATVTVTVFETSAPQALLAQRRYSRVDAGDPGPYPAAVPPGAAVHSPSGLRRSHWYATGPRPPPAASSDVNAAAAAPLQIV